MARSGHKALHIDTKDRSSSVVSMPGNTRNCRPFHTLQAQTCAIAPIHFICGTTLKEHRAVLIYIRLVVYRELNKKVLRWGENPSNRCGESGREMWFLLVFLFHLLEWKPGLYFNTVTDTSCRAVHPNQQKKDTRQVKHFLFIRLAICAQLRTV